MPEIGYLIWRHRHEYVSIAIMLNIEYNRSCSEA